MAPFVNEEASSRIVEWFWRYSKAEQGPGRSIHAPWEQLHISDQRCLLHLLDLLGDGKKQGIFCSVPFPCHTLNGRLLHGPDLLAGEHNLQQQSLLHHSVSFSFSPFLSLTLFPSNSITLELAGEFLVWIERALVKPETNMNSLLPF